MIQGDLEVLLTQVQGMRQRLLTSWASGEQDSSEVSPILRFVASDGSVLDLMPYGSIIAALPVVPPIAVALQPRSILGCHDAYVERFQEGVEAPETSLEERFLSGDGAVSEALVIEGIDHHGELLFVSAPYSVGLGHEVLWGEEQRQTDSLFGDEISGPVSSVLRLAASEMRNTALSLTIEGDSPYPFDIDPGDAPDVRIMKIIEGLYGFPGVLGYELA